ncbi:tyrosine-type recombinase/integrase [Ruminococcus albus]|uniref:Site-specific recombinase XerD n=1 Tax=Ruminococcus albus TaxID=1264 RepID=A0A1H7PJJ8_RUMAL|nr:tyrosine-type recombinase/integrase [Ruminococcus albus]SEL35952.1 Site-specific recombinase XerD [Ruminococcus albus]
MSIQSQRNTKSIYTPRFLFELKDFILEDTIDSKNKDIFPDRASKRNPVKRNRIPALYPFNNPYVDNEVRGFIQHLILDLHSAPGTVQEYIECFAKPWSKFINNHNEEQIFSVTQFAYEDIYSLYIEFLSDEGYKLTLTSVHHIGGDMEWLHYNYPSHHISYFIRYYKYIHSVAYPDTRSEYEKDAWDIRNLGIPFSTSVCRSRYTVSFRNISQGWLVKAAKEYCYYRIQSRTISAVLDDIKGLNLFSAFLEAEHSEINHLDELTRPIIEEYFAFIDKKNFVTTTYNRRISVLRTFLLIGNMLDLEHFPTKPLIQNDDYRRVVHKMPKCFSEFELKQMNTHINDLPIQIARIFFILENCGMRVSDICSSPINPNGEYCLGKNDNNEYIFTYYMPKAHRYNTIPVSDMVGEIIESAIEDSRNEFGENCTYIFAIDVDKPISSETFSHHMNVMAKNNDLRRDEGTPLRIKGHTFRGTVATRFANDGISMDVIRMMMGQRKMGVLNHYVKIHEKTMQEYLKPITEENEMMIQHIGKTDYDGIEPIPEPSLIPLSNGRCAKKVSTGICDHANRCYSCQMFRPSISCISLYEHQLNEAENNIAIAKLHGFDRILEKNEQLKEDLIRILKKLEAEKHE